MNGKVRIHTQGEGWNFIIHEDGDRLVWQFSAGFVTEGSCPAETSETEIINMVLHAHFDRRKIVKNIYGDIEWEAPFYDDPKLFPEAFVAKRELEAMAVGQRELFVS